MSAFKIHLFSLIFVVALSNEATAQPIPSAKVLARVSDMSTDLDLDWVSTTQKKSVELFEALASAKNRCPGLQIHFTEERHQEKESNLLAEVKERYFSREPRVQLEQQRWLRNAQVRKFEDSFRYDFFALDFEMMSDHDLASNINCLINRGHGVDPLILSRPLSIFTPIRKLKGTLFLFSRFTQVAAKKDWIVPHLMLTDEDQIIEPWIFYSILKKDNYDQSNYNLISREISEKERKRAKRVKLQPDQSYIQFFDHAQTDGDAIDIYIDGVLFKSNLSIESIPFDLEIPLSKRESWITLMAKDMGRHGLCTVSVLIPTGQTKNFEKKWEWQIKQGKGVTFLLER